MTTPTKSAFSLVAFACPVCAIGLAFAAQLLEDEELAFQIVGVGGIGFTVVAFVGLIGAFVRKEKMRWFTILPPLALLGFFSVGVSA